MIIKEQLNEFQKKIWNFYKKNKRHFLWRSSINPYFVVVSEIMLQQTQTQRVEQKFLPFIERFKTFNQLARADFADVLELWIGLGYNRRAQALYGIAQKVMKDFGGVLPDDSDTLQTFKGLGPATASSIVAFAFNKPTVFIETNIRAVFLHEFYRDGTDVHDNMLLPLIEATVCQKNPREWYYALMDYGVYLKKKYKNPSRKSKHHSVQSAFEGSDRQIRGAIMRMLIKEKELQEDILLATVCEDKKRAMAILQVLKKEKFVEKKKGLYVIAKPFHA